MPTRIQRQRTSGWRLADATTNPLGAVIVDRTSRYGNPFKIGVGADNATHATALYREWLENNTYEVHAPDSTPDDRQRMDARRDWILEHVHELAGKDVACPCDLPAPGEADLCHGAFLIELAEYAAKAANPYCTGDRCEECTPDEECCEATCGCCPRVDEHDHCRLAPGSEEDSKYCDQHGEGWLMERSPEAQRRYELLRDA